MLRASIFLVLVLASSVAFAQGGDAASEAKRLFVSGSELFLAHKYQDALEALKKSNDLIPSPNSALLIARCLRELGQPIEALERFEAVEADARARASQGDAKYLKSAEAAASEAAALRSTLGTLQVTVRNAPPGTRVEVAGVARPVGDKPLVLVQQPGEVTVRVLRPDGGTESNLVTVVAGSQSKLELDLHRNAEPVPAPPPDEGESRPTAARRERTWAMPAAVVSSGVAVVGFAGFAGFGIASQNIYDDLKRGCGASPCTSKSRPDADRGKNYQTLANVGLAVGVVGAAAAVTFFVLAATARPEKAQKTSRVLLTPLGVSGLW